MPEIPLKFDLVAFIVLIGIFLGFFLSSFLIIKSWKKNRSNLLMGYFILAISLLMLEGWLNYTGYMFRILWLVNFSEPFNFFVAPTLFLFVVSQFRPKKGKLNWLHYIPFIFWLLYCGFHFSQSQEFKFNSLAETYEMEQLAVPVSEVIPEDPLRLRSYVNLFTGVHFMVYMVLTVLFLLKEARRKHQNFWTSKLLSFRSARNTSYHLIAIVLIFTGVKIIFGNNDLGDHFIYLYITFMLLMNTIQIVNDSSYFERTSTFLEVPSLKYKKSSLSNSDKTEILNHIRSLMSDESYYKNSQASLSDLARRIGQSTHHVSQVINEQLNQSFFELLAEYRVEEAKRILHSEEGKRITIEEIAERVGYNSKSAFNSVFKKLSSQTPSQYRDSQ